MANKSKSNRSYPYHTTSFVLAHKPNAMTPGKKYPFSKEFALTTLRNRKTQFPAVIGHKAAATEL